LCYAAWFWQVADRCFNKVIFAVAAIEKPCKNAAVFAVAGPHKPAVRAKLMILLPQIGQIASVVITGRVDGEGNLRRMRLRTFDTSSENVHVQHLIIDNILPSHL